MNRFLLTLTLFYFFLNSNFISNKKIKISVFSYVIINGKNIKFLKEKQRIYSKKKIIKYQDVVTQKDISKINTLVLALLEYKKLHNNLIVPENYVLKSEENENLKNFKLWKKLQEIKSEKSENKRKYIYFILKKMNFPLNTIFTQEEIDKYTTEDEEITTISKLSEEDNINYDISERQEVRKELFSPFFKKTKDKKSENIKDFLALYKFIPKINEQNMLPKYSNKSFRKKGILKYILYDLKKDEKFNYQYNYYHDNIYNNINDDELNDYFKFFMKFKKTSEHYDFFVNRTRSFFNEENKKEKKYLLYTRRETEGGHSYDFDKWSFSDFIEALVFFNDLYIDLNKENYEKLKKDETKKLDIVDFNIIYPNFVIPSDDIWPIEWHGMYIEQIRMGDIDAKYHFIRRKILDYLLFDFKTSEYDNKYINFTWRKLYLGIAWFIHTRGHPIVISPFEKIQFDVFSMDFCKPEEIQGLFLGYLIIQAQTHEKIFWNNYRDRFDFLKNLEINIRSADELIF
ncbi:conserved Plasmodium protein, unknown function [Plasmodium relictum]|uniref:Fusion protein n=1 Tax=Plasmodium relictum TaxID=85471 RepID=A0A1J1H4X0_PLARL|nr:conserved Plasmodium protein, unknown function [Plasmodium relictum]CRG99794.1 conserved Plasmodium protein, unknown function [Plasmodium relictum]